MTSVQTEEALASVIVFTLHPLEFLLHFQVLRRHFPRVDSVTVGDGVVMLSSRSRGLVSLFSLDRILQERSFQAGLGDEVTVQGQRYVIGQPPNGLPINGQLLPTAPPIATFPAHQGYLEIGATPYHVVTRRKQCDGFEVHAVSDGVRVLTCGGLQPSICPEAATFIDDGPLIVQHSTSELRVFDLRSGQVVMHVDPLCFSVNFSPVPKCSC
ncbi:DDB1- and CUL4-associated factor 17-like [Pollicipes pollicipes]|uniref:DDB1- and CUL4-associated factor 17-like n=1 Tax=Pollicipes pollicipes TaxID=41117 RepID=UPI00188570AE|nr:DDB1- and CUL4-associated factor 17-like [Pollicipes pollicipes]